MILAFPCVQYSACHVVITLTDSNNSDYFRLTFSDLFKQPRLNKNSLLNILCVISSDSNLSILLPLILPSALQKYLEHVFFPLTFPLEISRGAEGFSRVANAVMVYAVSLTSKCSCSFFCCGASWPFLDPALRGIHKIFSLSVLCTAFHISLT